MGLRYRSRPGPGFVWLVVAALAGVAFFAWGLRTPALDRVWRLQLELLLGDRPQLTGTERQLLQDTLERYPDLADHMLDGAASGLISAHVGGTVDAGHAYAVRRDRVSGWALVVVSPAGDELSLEVRAGQVAGHGTASADEPLVWALPDHGPFPQLIEVHLAGDRRRAPAMLVELRPGADR